MADQQKSGNILSNISPPTELPSFITSSTTAFTSTDNQASSSINENTSTSSVTAKEELLESQEPFIKPSFTPAIPARDTTPSGNPVIPGSGGNHEMRSHSDNIADALSPITQSGSTIFGWVKGAVSSNSILQNIAEKAKNSVDSIVTTLDPQMREYINSGGDFEIIVASDKDDKVRPIREAFQTVFGKATVVGLPAQPISVAAQPVGFENGRQGANERIDCIRTNNPRADDGLPIVAVENFLVEIFPDQWFDAGFLMLFDYSKQLTIQSITQMTPIPSPIITALKEDTAADYEFSRTGFSTTVGSIMAKNLNSHHTEWHKTYTSVNRFEMILNAAKTLASLYKQAIISETSNN